EHGRNRGPAGAVDARPGGGAAAAHRPALRLPRRTHEHPGGRARHDRRGRPDPRQAPQGDRFGGRRLDPAGGSGRDALSRMTTILAALAPVFGLIVVGAILRWTGPVGDEGWRGIENLTYWVLLPALLV